jgi:hypothetical protein
MKLRTLLATGAVIAGAIVTGAADAAAPVPCAGVVLLTGTSNVEVRTAGPQTFVEFDFTGLHDVCLADGSRVQGTLAGHLVQRTSSSGDVSIHLEETLFYGGGTLDYRGEASLAKGRWQSHIQTVGRGTGPLAGIHGQGEFFPTGPTSFADVISYVYAP